VNHTAAGGIVIVLISGIFIEKRVKGHGRGFMGYSGGQMYKPPGLSALFCCVIAMVEDGKTGGCGVRGDIGDNWFLGMGVISVRFS
jgi:hypothetical protein